MSSPSPRPAEKTTQSTAPARPSPPPASSGWKWVGIATVIGGGILLGRAFLRGTAPAAHSRYAAYRQTQVGSMPPGWKAATPEARPEGSLGGHGTGRSAQGAQNQQQQRAEAYESARKENYSRYQQEQQQRERDAQAQEQREQRQREQAYDSSHGTSSTRSHSSYRSSSAQYAKSDYARYEEILAAERQYLADLADGSSSSFFEPDIDLNLDKVHQARADFVQSKFVHLKSGNKKLPRYQSWSGTRGGTSAQDEAEFLKEAEMAERMGLQAPEQDVTSAYKAMQRQMATQPRLVWDQIAIVQFNLKRSW
jgi:hypothetical protein